MTLETLGITENRIKALEKAGLCTVEDIQRFFPRAYYDFKHPTTLQKPLPEPRYTSVIGKVTSIKTDKTNETLMIKAKVTEKESGKTLHIIWIGAYYLYRIIKEWEGEDVIVCGKLEYRQEYHSYHMNNPIIFDRNIENNLKIYPVYKKMKGISQEFMDKTISQALSCPIEETLPAELVRKYHLLGLKEAISIMHSPDSMEDLDKARKRLVYDKLLYFATNIEKEDRFVSKGSIYNIKTVAKTMKYIESLPFKLTDSQQNVFKSMKDAAYEGKRINALVQGDVGSGKTMIAFLMMFAMADSGYQSVLMAPTVILARQHYLSLKETAEKFGFKAVFLSGDTPKKEKTQILKEIEQGECQFIIGTHSVLGEAITYKDLSLVVIDEEQKFGVQQREIVSEKAKFGVHKISMSATPIPRTLAGAVYGTGIEVYDLELPAERKPVQTAIFNNDQKIFEFILKKIKEGQQAYVVCPFIDDPEEKTSVQTVEVTYDNYCKYFHPKGIQIGCVTGKTKKQEADDIIAEFASGKTKILIATTIIEVGVNVPKANIIVINNAERFGLSQLHQLRGRVGRGSDPGYCILKSSDRENPRLLAICKTTNGFEIAKEDMRLRGSGNLLGTEQSGQNEYINLILQYPNMYEFAKRDAKELVDQGLC